MNRVLLLNSPPNEKESHPSLGALSHELIAVIRRYFLASLILCAFLVSSDYGIYLAGPLPYAFVVACIFVLLILSRRIAPTRSILIYSMVVVPLSALNIAAGSGFNFVLLVPIVSYIAISAGPGRETMRGDFLILLDIIVFLIIPVLLAAELYVKLTGSEFLVFKELIENTGQGRFDVIRMQSPFGSPLSLAAFCVAAAAIYIFFYESLVRLSFVLAISIMTGTRTTSFLLIIMMVVFVLMLILRNHRAELQFWLALIFRACFPVFAVAVIVYSFSAIFSPLTWNSTFARVFGYSSFDIMRDESFVGRSDTTLLGASEIIDHAASSAGMWRVFIYGMPGQQAMDSALVSIAWESGLIASLSFFVLFFYLLFKSDISLIFRCVFGLVFLITVFMMGDAVVPPVSLVYFAALYLFCRSRCQPIV